MTKMPFMMILKKISCETKRVGMKQTFRGKQTIQIYQQTRREVDEGWTTWLNELRETELTNVMTT